MQEPQKPQVWSLGQEDHLEKEMATHSSILAWEIPWTEESGGLQFMGHKELDTTEQALTSDDKNANSNKWDTDSQILVN